MRAQVLALAGLLLTRMSAAADGDLPIVDTHIHYSQDAWTAYSPAAVLALLDEGGIRRAFVSSTPDEGTIRLHAAAPDRVVPVLRPYRGPGELSSWMHDPATVPYLEERLRQGIYRGIGEFHLYGAEAGASTVSAVAALAADRGLFLHCHCDEAAVETLLGWRAGVTVLWAHAGMSSGPGTVGALLDRHPRLLVELALRSDVAPGGVLTPEWRALFLRHADRFLVGTDTWVASRLPEIPAVQAATRVWLRQLPADVARRLASDNADRLAGPAR